MKNVQEHLEERNGEEHTYGHRPRPLVKTHNAAMESGLSVSFLYHNWRTIPAARRAGNALRWDVDQLLGWMRKQAQAP